jgi:hypothetical protein
MNSPVMMRVIHYPIPLLCRLWHSWTLDHQTWGWDYYECKRCGGRKVIGPPSDEADMERMDLKWVCKDKGILCG